MNILKYLLIACSCLIGAAHAQSPIAKDTIEYRAQVWVDKTDSTKLCIFQADIIS